MSRPLDIKPSPEVQEAMQAKSYGQGDAQLTRYMYGIYQQNVNHSAAIEELTMNMAVVMQMLRDVWGVKKYDERQAKAIATLFPPTEEAREIERLRAKVQDLEAKLNQREDGDGDQDETVEQDDETDDENS